MAKRKRETDTGRTLEINMTPMIDCVFLLIAFFVTVTQLKQLNLVEVKLPRVDLARPDDKPEYDRLTISVTPDDKVHCAGAIRSLGDLDVILRIAREEALDPTRTYGTRPILIRADEASSFGRIQDIFYHCQQQKLRFISIGASPARPGARPAPKG